MPPRRAGRTGAQSPQPAELEPTPTPATRRRRVPPDQPRNDGPKYYTGAKPWNELTAAEKAAVEEAAQNSVRFWEA